VRTSCSITVRNLGGSITAVVLILVLGAVIALVVDLDRPRDGVLEVSQQPLVDLQEQIGVLPPAIPREGPACRPTGQLQAMVHDATRR